jgi:hypothetical protein
MLGIILVEYDLYAILRSVRAQPVHRRNPP